MAEETEKRSFRGTTLLIPEMGITLRDTNISLFCNGSTRLYLLNISAQPLCSQFTASVALCLAPTDTSLKEHPRLLLCVLAFIELFITRAKQLVKQIFIQRHEFLCRNSFF